MTENFNPVIFAGAGPGDPELITVKGQQALMAADLVIYAGSLVPKELLIWTKKNAAVFDSAGMNLDEIVEMIVNAHKENKKIVRLHTGDPSLYGAIHEQIAMLKKHEIPCMVIPGVTAAFAAAASMNMEYTLPEISQTLIFTRISGRTKVPELESLELLASHKTSMAIYLSISHIEKVQNILAGYYGENSLCAVAYKVSHPDEKIYYTKIKDLLLTVKENEIKRQALIIVGKAVASAKHGINSIKSQLYDSNFSHGFRSKTE